jgi:hypothetical protein
LAAVANRFKQEFSETTTGRKESALAARCTGFPPSRE